MPLSLAVSQNKVVASIGSETVLFNFPIEIKRTKTPQKALAHADSSLPNYLEFLDFTPSGDVIAIEPRTKAVILVDSTTLEIKGSCQMPKRPSAFSFIPNDPDHIIVADKFGDVYKIPLAVREYTLPENAEPLLGHVSMVLDVLCVGNHLITCDRDEHIRVSKLDEPYIIETFLFGHKNYVSTLASLGNRLYSAGGDSFVLGWDLSSFGQTARLDLEGEINVSELVAVPEKNKLLILIEQSTSLLVVDADLNLEATLEVGVSIACAVYSNGFVYIACEKRIARFLLQDSLGQSSIEWVDVPGTEFELFQQHRLRKQPEF